MTLTPEMVDSDSCPFCGSFEISDGEVLTEHPSGRVTTQSMCNGCGALGPEADTGNVPDYGSVKARTAWNARAQPQRAVGVEELEALVQKWQTSGMRGHSGMTQDACANDLRALIERAGGGS